MKLHHCLLTTVVHNVCLCTCVCVGEWSRCEWWLVIYIHGRQEASGLVSWQQRWHIGRWPWQSSHSTAEQSTTARTCPHQQRLTSQAAVSQTIISQWTQFRTLHSTQQQRWLAAPLRHLKVHATMTDRLISAVYLCFVISALVSADFISVGGHVTF